MADKEATVLPGAPRCERPATRHRTGRPARHGHLGRRRGGPRKRTDSAATAHLARL